MQSFPNPLFCFVFFTTTDFSSACSAKTLARVAIQRKAKPTCQEGHFGLSHFFTRRCPQMVAAAPYPLHPCLQRGGSVGAESRTVLVCMRKKKKEKKTVQQLNTIKAAQIEARLRWTHPADVCLQCTEAARDQTVRNTFRSVCSNFKLLSFQIFGSWARA